MRLLIEIFAECGMWESWIPYNYPPPDWFMHRNEERYLQGMTERADPVAPPWKVGDILTYRYGRCVSHAGIYLGEHLMVHAPPQGGVSIVDMRSRCYTERFAGGWRLKCLSQ